MDDSDVLLIALILALFWDEYGRICGWLICLGVVSVGCYERLFPQPAWKIVWGDVTVARCATTWDQMLETPFYTLKLSSGIYCDIFLNLLLNHSTCQDALFDLGTAVNVWNQNTSTCLLSQPKATPWTSDANWLLSGVICFYPVFQHCIRRRHYQGIRPL
jgi:hypothetical protein